MADTISEPGAECLSISSAHINHLFNYCEQILLEHRLSDPDLYRLINEQKAISTAIACTEKDNPALIKSPGQKTDMPAALVESIYFKQFQQAALKEKIAINQQFIHEELVATQSLIAPRAKAYNRKQSHTSIEDERIDRSDKLSAQIQAWRSLLPILIRRFAKIHDPRRAKSVKHQLAIVMLYGLFAFIFRLKITT